MMMKSRETIRSWMSSWAILTIGGIGIIISALIDSDWATYTCIMIANSGAIRSMYKKRRGSHLGFHFVPWH